jgi:predicted DNA-binding transcriptional regulator AlpA
MTLFPDPEASSVYESEAVRQARADIDHLVSINDIRALFKLGRTAAYELTHRPGFPAPVQVSRRCLRWWASEVDAYAQTLQREGARRRASRMTAQRVTNSAALPRRISGTVRAARGRRQPK